MRRVLYLTVMLAIAIAAVTSAAAQKSLPSTGLSSQASPVHPSPAATPVPIDNQGLQLILAKLAAETARADAAEKAKADQAELTKEWKSIANKEAERAKTIEAANAERREEAASLRAANGFLRTSVDEYKIEDERKQREIDRLRSRQKWLFGGGAALGAGICAIPRLQ